MDPMQVLWIVLAILAVLVVVLVVRSARTRKLERDRADAEALRARAQENEHDLRQQEVMAAQADAAARKARAEADAKAAEAERLQAEADRSGRQRDELLARHAEQLREADRLDPDVRTDKHGNRLDGGRTVEDDRAEWDKGPHHHDTDVDARRSGHHDAPARPHDGVAHTVRTADIEDDRAEWDRGSHHDGVRTREHDLAEWDGGPHHDDAAHIEERRDERPGPLVHGDRLEDETGARAEPTVGERTVHVYDPADLPGSRERQVRTGDGTARMHRVEDGTRRDDERR